MKRVLVGGMHHESNTFNPILTGMKDIWVKRGNEILSMNENNSMKGVVSTLLEAGYEVVPTLLARAVPNGEWDYDVYMQLKNELLLMIKNAGEIDAICLTLHGSMRVHNLGEAEGDLLHDIRLIWPSIPLITSLDMHATITPRMLQYANGFVGYKCAPHTDTFETGIHAANMVVDILDHGAKPSMSMCRIPMLVAGEQSETSVEPMKSLMSNLRLLEKRPHVMAASYLLGFPWADSSPNSIVSLVVTDGDKNLSDELSKELAEVFWARREEFHFYNETLFPEKALEVALKKIDTHAPVVISDSGDNPTAGSSGDVTNFLKMIINNPLVPQLYPPLIYQCFYDPSLVELCIKKGIGSTFIGSLGASFDKEKSTPIMREMSVHSIRKNWDNNGVDIVLLSVGSVDVVVSSHHVGAYDPEMMKSLGVDPHERKIIVVKLGYLEPEIRAISNYSVMALTDGSSNEVLTSLDYKNITRPIYPLDTDFEANLVVS
ncbi:MAG: M81 family peptidase [Spirochaetia bacterium]|nr:M81 family peptidase [Spirochaetia bacterium]